MTLEFDERGEIRAYLIQEEGSVPVVMFNIKDVMDQIEMSTAELQRVTIEEVLIVAPGVVRS